ncbi:hypothetical protein ABZ362_31230 [Streptomyces sp. NPDC005951]|uniref:hypothetical protein n=1 Tax=Streptomyces sp. NPDC005951 TaxID=3154573 RepID=UPI0033CF9830
MKPRSGVLGKGTCKHTDAVPFGKPLTVPSPFDVQLPDTGVPGPRLRAGAPARAGRGANRARA